MGKLYRLERCKRSTRQSHPPMVFDRSEINLLLSLYSRRVMSGEWRD